MRAVVAHGERGEHKPRTEVEYTQVYFLFIVLQGHREGVALLVVWHHGVRLWANGLGVRLDGEMRYSGGSA